MNAKCEARHVRQIIFSDHLPAGTDLVILDMPAARPTRFVGKQMGDDSVTLFPEVVSTAVVRTRFGVD